MAGVVKSPKTKDLDGEEKELELTELHVARVPSGQDDPPSEDSGFIMKIVRERARAATEEYRSCEPEASATATVPVAPEERLTQPMPTPPQKVQDPSEPGAYLCAPGQLVQRTSGFSPSHFQHQEADILISVGTSMSVSTDDAADEEEGTRPRREEMLVEAQEVSSQSLDLGEATEVDPEDLMERIKYKKELNRKTLCVYGCTLLAAFVVVMTGALLSVVLNQNTTTNNSSSKEVSPTPMPTTTTNTNTSSTATSDDAIVPITDTDPSIVAGLPNYTLESLQDPFSPQYQAYQWLARHRNLTTLEEWRKKQLFAMATAYYSFDGPNWPLGLNEDWLDDSKSECDWYSGLYGSFFESGVGYQPTDSDKSFACNDKGEFSVLRMATGKLFGFSAMHKSFPRELGWLTSLQYISLSENDITNLTTPYLFPPEFYQLTKLQHLSIFDNPVGSYPIPSELGLLTKLTRLSMHQNGMTSTIPTELGLLTDLIILDVHENELSGSLPTELGLLTNLGRFRARRNGHTGQIPSELGLWTSHGYRIDLGFNRLTGTVPTEIENLVDLGWFSVKENLLSGTMPEGMCPLRDPSCTYTSIVSMDPQPCGYEFDCNDQLCGCGCSCTTTP